MSLEFDVFVIGPIGAATPTVIPVRTTDTGHSSGVHVPTLSPVVSGDVAYNQTHMWLSGRVQPQTGW
jgi:hypothetical protein